jgi:hypothetical protein
MLLSYRFRGDETYCQVLHVSQRLEKDFLEISFCFPTASEEDHTQENGDHE